jgi:hypothetical protein
MRRASKYGLYALALGLLALAFALYTQPVFLFTLANQVWACF